MPTTAPPHSPVIQALARSRLGVPAVTAFVLAAAAPLTVVAGSAATGFAVTGFVGVPVVYLTVGVLLAVFSAGYVAMARHVRQAGGFYTYVTLGLGRVPGVGAALVTQLGYNCLQISLYGAFGAVAADLARAGGWHLPWWLCAGAAWALVAVLGLRSVRVNGRVLGTLLVLELAVVVVFDLAMVSHPAAGGVTLTALSPAHLADPGAIAILVGGLAGFVGYEATVVFAEEVRDPRRTVALATYLALGLIATLYALSTWAMTVAAGPAHVVAAAREHDADLFFALAAPHLPAALVDLGRLLLLTSLFAALVAFHHMIARYTFSLAREGLLPAALGRTGRLTGAPVHGSLLQSGLALTVLGIFAGAGLDPIRHLFFTGGVTGGLGVLVLMAATSVAVIGYFARDGRGEPVWRRVTAPTVAAAVLVTVLVVTVAGFGALLDLPGDSPLRWLLPAGYAVAATAGAGWALILRATRPRVYAAIGLGPDSATVVAATPSGARRPDPVRA
ncbi:APC family permease [Polymorphospora rubra]|uniref:Amino acid permease n=1 Tax=Polymorphospora rubra TaxID=338584 RepID=A0A810N995_9ACTN|nr:APC family permease [Polymorphospora rubra]BCJ68699.1 amino acid permease [Polymorphospora rubra]